MPPYVEMARKQNGGYNAGINIYRNALGPDLRTRDL